MERKVRNPKGLDYGCIVVIRNYGKVVSGTNFTSHFEKSDFLIKSAHMISKRRDRGNRYDIRVHYGIWLQDYVAAFDSHQVISY